MDRLFIDIFAQVKFFEECGILKSEVICNQINFFLEEMEKGKKPDLNWCIYEKGTFLSKEVETSLSLGFYLIYNHVYNGSPEVKNKILASYED